MILTPVPKNVIARLNGEIVKRRKQNLSPIFPVLAVAIALVVVGTIEINRRYGLAEQASIGLAPQPPEPHEDQPWSYFHPAWRKETTSTEATLDETIRRIVTDPKNRIEKEFQVSSGLKERVVFWMKVYARFNSRMRIVHDRTNPSIIYGYIDFRPLYRQLGTSRAVDAKTYKMEKQILKTLTAKLRDGADLTHSGAADASERAEISAFFSRAGAAGAKESAELIAGLRTQSGQTDFFQQALFRSRNLLPHIEAVFRRQNLPVALGRIPFVESSFNARAYSKGGAMGIWQFMPETAKQMIRGKSQADWADPLKQTASATKVLRMYRSLLPDWGTTVTSYNSGVGRVRKLVAKHKLKSVEGLIEVKDDDGLGFAGKNFYSEFLAANYVEAYKEELFEHPGTEPLNPALVFKGATPFQSEACDKKLNLGI